MILKIKINFSLCHFYIEKYAGKAVVFLEEFLNIEVLQGMLYYGHIF